MKRVVLTRQDNSALAAALKESGVECVDMPLIESVFAVSQTDAADVFDELGGYDWITFSSPNAVRGFFKAFFAEFKDIRCLGIARIACVGEGTARELAKFYINADVIPEKSTAVDMAEAMGNFESLENLKVLSVVGNLAMPGLVKTLEAKRAIVDTFEVYKTLHIELDASSPAVAEFRDSGAHVIVFSSPSAIESFVKNASKLALGAGAVRPKIVAIGETTAAAAKKASMPVGAVSPSARAEDIAACVLSLL